MITVFAAFFGALGYGMLFNLPWKFILPAAMAGFISRGVFVGAESLLSGIFLSTCIAAATAQLLGEIMARIAKTPTTLFYIPAIVPLIPGGNLYRTLDALVRSNFDMAIQYGSITLLSALGIAVGICSVSAMVMILHNVKAHIKANR